MAVTKIHAIKSTLSKALDYIENPDKTEDQLLISGYNVDPMVASVEYEMTASLAMELKGNYTKTGRGNNLAYHMIQSFSPDDEVTPEEAHEIGKKLADEFLDGKYEYVIATHVDKDHIHNHIIFNAVSFVDLKKIRTQPYKTAAKIRAISDRLCSEHDLSVIKEGGKLGHSYTEYQARKNNTSWKSEIRKRLAFILETATTYDEFKSASLALGVKVVDAGKNIKYQIEGQTRFTRGDKLSDIGTYLKDGIIEKVMSNASSQIFVKNAIKSAAEKADTYEQFVALLKDSSVVCKRDKTGASVYKINDVNANQVKERALGAAYSTDSIKAAIKNREFTFESTTETDIADEFNKTVRTKVEEQDTRLRLTKENIRKITVDGILLNVPEDQGNGMVFIDNNHVNLIEEKQEYDIFLGSKYDYYFVNEKLDPDLPEAEQLSGKYLKGENLIRSLELQNGVKPIELDISSTDIKSVSNKGVVLTLPDSDIESIFIENQYVSYDRGDGGSCHIKIYKNWNYSFRTADPAKSNVLQNIDGRNLIGILESRSVVKEQSLINKIAALERRNTLSGTKALANTLLLMRQENINQHDDFDIRLSELQQQAQQIRGTIKEIEDKTSQYKKAAKYLIAFNQYLPVKQEASQQNPLFKKKFERQHESELQAFDYAAEQLEKLNVNTNVDPEKVLALVKNQEEKGAELSASLKTVTEKLESIQDAKDIVREIQQNKPLEQGEKKKDREEER